MKKYTAVIVGCGPRGRHHARGFLANADRFDLVAICDMDADRLKAASDEFGISKTYTDAEGMLSAEKPDVFCFATQPTVRLPLVELGVKHNVKAIAFEKPMALSLAEAKKIHDLCGQAGVKYTVSHQQKYAKQWQKVKAAVDSGEIGDVHTIHATTKNKLLNLGTHLLDYVLWYNNGHHAQWVIGHVHGREQSSGTHASPDMVLAKARFENGVHGIFEFGDLAPDYPQFGNRTYLANAVSIYGSHGYAKAMTDGYWQMVTKSSAGKVLSGQEDHWPDQESCLQTPYLKALADWLDDPEKIHPNNGDISYHGFEIAMGMCMSSYERRRIDLPIERIPAEPILETLKRELPNESTATE